MGGRPARAESLRRAPAAIAPSLAPDVKLTPKPDSIPQAPKPRSSRPLPAFPLSPPSERHQGDIAGHN